MQVVTLPDLITVDEFPNVSNIGNVVLLDNNDLFPFMNEPEFVMRPVQQVQQVQQTERKFCKNGISVLIRGSLDDVTAVVNALEANPPIKQGLTTTGIGCSTSAEQVGSHANVTFSPSGTKYSGSGSLIIVKNRQDGKQYFVLFKNKNTGKFNELGGRIDYAPNTSVPVNILFTNSIKESLEESALLFNLNTQSNDYVDIFSSENNTYYRVYLYVFSLDNADNLIKWYTTNKAYIDANAYGDAYKETNELQLFETNSFIADLNSIPAIATDGKFIAKNNTANLVGVRTVKTIRAFNNSGKFNNLTAMSGMAPNIVTGAITKITL
jgi:hypothetical protein